MTRMHASMQCLLVHVSIQSCLTLCDPMDCSWPGFSIHGILQARILEWVTMPSSRFDLGDQTNPGVEPESFLSPALAGRFFTTSATWKAGGQDGVSLQSEKSGSPWWLSR